jgi:hypothetical protein
LEAFEDFPFSTGTCGAHADKVVEKAMANSILIFGSI